MNKKQRATYKKLLNAAPDGQTCLVCGQDGMKQFMSPHHPCGRDGPNGMRVVWVHEIPCHHWIHHEVEESTERGFLWKKRNTHYINDEEWQSLLQLMKESK